MNKVIPAKALTEEILQEKTSETLESEGKLLHELAVVKSLDLSQKVFPLLQKALVENPEISKENEDFDILVKVCLQANMNKSKFETAQRTFARVQERIESRKPRLVEDQELEEARKIVLNKFQTAPNELHVEDNLLYETIVRTYVVNAAISSGLFHDGGVIDVKELEEINPRVAAHAKKTALDQICASNFNHYPVNYDAQKVIEHILPTDDNFPLVQALKNLGLSLDVKQLKPKQSAIVYANLTPMVEPEFQRYASFVNVKDGNLYAIENNAHFYDVKEIPCEIAGRKVKVAVPVWYGIIYGDRI